MRWLRMNTSNSSPASTAWTGRRGILPERRSLSRLSEGKPLTAIIWLTPRDAPSPSAILTTGSPCSWACRRKNCAMVGRCGPSLVIESDGSVYPCDFYALDAWKLGSISDDSLRRMLTGEREQAFLAESLPVPSACRACRWYSLCRNGCKARTCSPKPD